MRGNLHAVQPSGRADRGTAVTYDAAWDAFDRADFETCRILLSLCEDLDPGVDILRALLYRIFHDVEAWYEAAKRASQAATISSDRLTALALTALAARHGKMPEADARFRDLREAIDVASIADCVYARYLVAVDLWERDCDEVESYVEQTLSLCPDHSESIALLGWAAFERQDLRVAGAFFKRALAISLASHPEAKRHIAKVAVAAAQCAMECADLALGRKVRGVLDSIEWTPGLATEHVASLFARRGLALLEGDLVQAWLYAREMPLRAATAGFEAFGETDAAVCASELGDQTIARLHFERAWKLIRKYSWAGCGADERVALWHFAKEAAHVMPSEARQALMMYGGHSEGEFPPDALTKNVALTTPFERYAAGRVCEALGERSQAIELYRSALAAFEAMPLLCRSASVALDLLRLSRDDRYREPIARLAKRAPKATIVAAAAKLEGPLGLLGPIQREILSKILAGNGALAIASDLKRSRFTVINHTRTIFTAFEVHSRPELRRVCAALELTAETVWNGSSSVAKRGRSRKRL